MARTKSTKKTENTAKKEIVANNKKTILNKVKEFDTDTSENNENMVSKKEGEDMAVISNADILAEEEDKTEKKNDTSDSTMEAETTVLEEVIKESSDSSKDGIVKCTEKPNESTKRYMKDVYGYNWMGQCTDW